MSTITSSVDGQIRVVKTYSNARKLAQIGDLPIGVFIYGMGNLGARSVHGLVLEFSRLNYGTAAARKRAPKTVRGVANGLAKYVGEVYSDYVKEAASPLDLGLYVAGYSTRSALAEEWCIEFPNVTEPILVQDKNKFGVNWRAIYIPFMRLFTGCDIRILPILLNKMKEKGATEETLHLLNQSFSEIYQENTLPLQVVIDAMPIQDAINFAVYVLQTTIGYTTFEIGTPSCGGELQVAVISEDAGFRWVSEPGYRIIKEGAHGHG
ncbi:MAG: hypothetical protein OXG09_11975 [Chloroflexi bacterium]|nr:hypothetical protein [Chloroflexota bacterium]